MKVRNLVAIAGVAFALSLMSGCSSSTPEQRDTGGQITGAGNVDAFSLHVGDCLISSALQDTFQDVPGVPCTEGHDSEVIYIFDMPDGTYDETAIDDAAQDACAQGIVDYVGPNYASLTSQGLDWSYFSPSQDSWNQRNDREVDCVAYTVSEENELTSSVKGMGD
ncbi:MAG: septum formation family protein [Propionibacteriaceae bacterium]|nr:septum formation family protein [Propionibacteriaceae bacterium]